MKHKEFPYRKYENTKLWLILDETIEDLVINKDISEQTSREYIIGYLIKKLEENGSVKLN